MLKKFFMNTLSSFMGAWIALVLFGVVAVLVGIGIVAKLGVTSSTPESIKKGSVLTIDLSGSIVERETPTQIDYLSLVQGDVERPQTLIDLVTAIGEAKENSNISAIYLKCGGVSASPATLHALREALLDFLDSNKKIIAYANNFMMGDYYLASVANKVYMNPGGQLILQGLGGTSIYFKNLFDKLGVQFQVVKVGTFKSAVEPYIMNEMSEPARAQLDTLYTNLWNVICKDISSTRKKLTPDSINKAISEDFIFLEPAQSDLKAGFVDQLVYERSMDSIIAKTLNKDVKKLNFVGPSVLLSQTDWGSAYGAKKRVAVLYATGEIVDGGGSSTINYKKLVPQIVELADNKDVKALVLRVNSPGGAVFGSEQIGEALDYFKSKGKPLAVSMGDYAASGGYWISCGADRIFADSLTITGSIGIFGLIPNVKGLAEKIGVTPQTVSTNPDSNFPALYYPMTEKQQAAMQKYVEGGYDKFVARVAKGRGLSEEVVRRIGEGRVWDAMKAKEIGLVDELGNLQDAIDWVAEKSKLGDSYNVALYPSIEATMWDFLPEFANMKANEAMRQALGGNYDEIAVNWARTMLTQKPIQARMPYMQVGFPQPLAW
ncbi:MAG: signal peptide peptidase SppA [Muribaculaceae bacterium]|nr:signal peptide peptidase SppA [Muribaculaceae bacterium]